MKMEVLYDFEYTLHDDIQFGNEFVLEYIYVEHAYTLYDQFHNMLSCRNDMYETNMITLIYSDLISIQGIRIHLIYII